MTKRIQKLVMAVAALAALGLGGAVFAQAQSSPAHTTPAITHQTATQPADNAQSGDQTAPDPPGSTSEQAASETPAASEQPGAENPEQPGTGSESATGSDGPGGHADQPGNTGADHQFQGTE
jgi:hypothetical protein